MAILSILLTTIIIIVSILLVLIVLVQRPKQEGLGAAFGGGAFDSALGAHTTDVLQKITTYMAVIFFISAIGLAMVKSRQFSDSPASNVLDKVEALEKEKENQNMPSAIQNFPDLPKTEEAIPPLKTNKAATPPVTEKPGDPAKSVEEKAAPEKPKAATPEKPEAAKKPEEKAPAPEKPAPKGKGEKGKGGK